MEQTGDEFFSKLMTIIEDEKSDDELARVQKRGHKATKVATAGKLKANKHPKSDKSAHSKAVVKGAAKLSGDAVFKVPEPPRKHSKKLKEKKLKGKVKGNASAKQPKMKKSAILRAAAESEWNRYFKFDKFRPRPPVDEDDLTDLDDIVKQLNTERLSGAVRAVLTKPSDNTVRPDFFKLKTEAVCNDFDSLRVLNGLSAKEYRELENVFKDAVRTNTMSFVGSIEDSISQMDVETTVSSEAEAAGDKQLVSVKQSNVASELDGLKAGSELIYETIKRLGNRVNRLRIMQLAKHATEEICGLFEHTARLSLGSEEPTSSKQLRLPKPVKRIPARNRTPMLRQPIPIHMMRKFMRKIKHTAKLQHEIMQIEDVAEEPEKRPRLGRPRRQPPVNIEPPAPEPSAKKAARRKMFKPKISVNSLRNCNSVSRNLKQNMLHLRDEVDSDATVEASSSEDELEKRFAKIGYKKKRPSKSLENYETWKYYQRKAILGEQMKYVQLSVHNLDDEIACLDNLLRDMKKKKSRVLCQAAVDYMENLTGEGGGEGVAKKRLRLEGAARTRGFLPERFQKRRLIMTPSLHLTSKFIGQPSDTKCLCTPPISTCVLCTGRDYPLEPRRICEDLSMDERLGRVNEGYHPVLSYRKNISATMTLEDIACRPSWQDKMIKTRPKGIARTIWKEYREHSTVPLPKRRYIKRSDREAIAAALNGPTSEAAAAAAAAALDALNASKAATYEIQKAAYTEFPAREYPERMATQFAEMAGKPTHEKPVKMARKRLQNDY